MIIKCFGIARDILDNDHVSISEDINTVAALRTYLNNKHSELGRINNYMIAVNQEYADDDQLIQNTDEIAIIPPVSGG